MTVEKLLALLAVAPTDATPEQRAVARNLTMQLERYSPGTEIVNPPTDWSQAVALTEAGMEQTDSDRWMVVLR